MELSHFPVFSRVEVVSLEPGPELWSNTSDYDFLLESDEPKRLHWNMLGLLTVIAATGAGNLLVCAAVCRERALQNMANYFLLSLAIADFLVSVTVMPVAMTVLLFGAYNRQFVVFIIIIILLF